MNASDVVGYAFDGATYCYDCRPDVSEDAEDDVSPIFAGSEWDSYPTCDTCHDSIESVELVNYACKTCGREGPNVARTGNPDECLACSRIAKAIAAYPGWQAPPLSAEHPTLLAFTSHGSYPVAYWSPDGESLCPDCALEGLDDPDKRAEERVCYSGVYYEGPALDCCECGHLTESAYGDPDETKGEEG
jgi:hypothetical protein